MSFASSYYRSLDYSWKLKPGPQESDHYGLELARAVGFPSSVLDHAATVARGNCALVILQHLHAACIQSLDRIIK